MSRFLIYWNIFNASGAKIKTGDNHIANAENFTVNDNQEYMW